MGTSLQSRDPEVNCPSLGFFLKKYLLHVYASSARFHVQAWCWRTRRGRWTDVKEGRKQLFKFREWNLGRLQEQQLLLTIPPTLVFVNLCLALLKHGVNEVMPPPCGEEK